MKKFLIIIFALLIIAAAFQGDVIRNRMTGLINGSYLTMSIESGQDYVTEFKARIGDNGTTMATKKGTVPHGAI
jgi:hypothetical protein